MQSAHYLWPLFTPRSIAVVGASERPGALGRFVFENVLRAEFHGTVYPVNPKYKSVLGFTAYRNLDDLPETPDLLIVTTPAHTVADVLHDAGARGTRAAVVLSAGFGEIGNEGKQRAQQVTEEIRKYGMRMLGPNCLGILRPSIGLNATFANVGAKPGALALVAQSGAVCTAILDWAATTEIGFSSVISLGGALDLDFGELLDYLVEDPETRSILLYVEGVRDAKRFMSALRSAARVKPVVVLKAGRNAGGASAVTSHTGALAGSDEVWDAALARAGAVRVQSSLQLFAAARLLADPRIARSLKGERLAIITNGGGPGVVAADEAGAAGLKLATLEAATLKALDEVLPTHWSHGNPVDLIGDATAQRFTNALRIVLADQQVDAVLAMYCPQAITSADDAARAVIPLAREALEAGSKPVFTAWLGGASIISARQLFEEAGVPNFLTPENAVDAFAYLAHFRRHQQMLLQASSAAETMSFHDLAQAIGKAKRIRDAVLAQQRTLLTEIEAKQLLEAFEVPVSVGRLAGSADEAAALAAETGFPVVLKLVSPDITHKSDAGGVRLNLINERQVRVEYAEMLRAAQDAAPTARIQGINVQPMLKFDHARELLIGISRDVTFGPVIAFGAGGVSVEQVRDTALSLPPLNLALAADMVKRTHISRILKAYRNVPAVDGQALQQLLVRVATIAAVLPWVRELDLNPVLAHPKGIAVVDARVVIDATSPVTDTRYQHMSIFPYPVELERVLRLKDGTPVHMRAIRPDDVAREREFVAGLSDTSRYYRFMQPMHALSDDMLARFTQLDYDREMALIALTPDETQIVGVARYYPNVDGLSVEFAIAIGDTWQGKGLGAQLLQNLIACARDAAYARMEGTVLRSNRPMLTLASHLGFTTLAPTDDGHDVVRVELDLRA